MLVPVWVIFAAAAIFGCSAYLAMNVAGFVYAKATPFDDGPKPGTVGLYQTLAIVFGAAIIGAISASRGADLPSLAVVDLIVFALSAVIWTDVTRGIIGDWFTLPPIALVVLLGLVKHDIVPVLVSLAIVTIPFAIAAAMSKGLGMGWGDVKLVALGGALLDIQTSMIMFAGACMVACAIAFARRKRSEPIAFAPYLATAIAIGMIIPRAASLT